MKITYLGHSGFLVETGRHYLLFDYYTGKLPVFLPEKKLTVFVSHNHQDHFNKAIFDIQETYRNGPEHITYVLSRDIRKKHAEGLVREENELLFVRAHQSYELYGGALRIETLRSTDIGVAYIVAVTDFPAEDVKAPESGEVKDRSGQRETRRCLYHAGDLNLWKWEGEEKAVLNNMEANYRREMELLRGRKFDAAFVPLDPRLEHYAFGGLDIFLEMAEAEMVFPMHFWKQPEIIREYLVARPQVKNVVMLGEEGKCYHVADV